MLTGLCTVRQTSATARQYFASLLSVRWCIVDLGSRVDRLPVRRMSIRLISVAMSCASYTTWESHSVLANPYIDWGGGRSAIRYDIYDIVT